MTEQFRVNRPFGNGSTVHGNVLSMLAPAVLVYYLRKALLSHTTLSGNQYRKSVGATWIAISMARISASLLPIMPKRNFTCCISAFVILQIFFYTIEFQFVAIVTFLVILLAQRICMCLFLTLAVTEHIYCHIDSLPE